MAEYVDRYDIGSLESTVRKYGDLEIVKRIITKYMLRYKALVGLELVLVFLKMITVLAGPYLYKVVLDVYITKTQAPGDAWLAALIQRLAVSITGISEPSLVSLLLVSALIYTAIALVQWVITSTQQYYVAKLGLLVIADIRADFFSHTATPGGWSHGSPTTPRR
jgi:ABC-type multidrug transport system fused ATPase/permease subunit